MGRKELPGEPCVARLMKEGFREEAVGRREGAELRKQKESERRKSAAVQGPLLESQAPLSVSCYTRTHTHTNSTLSWFIWTLKEIYILCRPLEQGTGREGVL